MAEEGGVPSPEIGRSTVVATAHGRCVPTDQCGVYWRLVKVTGCMRSMEDGVKKCECMDAYVSMPYHKDLCVNTWESVY